MTGTEIAALKEALSELEHKQLLHDNAHAALLNATAAKNKAFNDLHAAEQTLRKTAARIGMTETKYPICIDPPSMTMNAPSPESMTARATILEIAEAAVESIASPDDTPPPAEVLDESPVDDEDQKESAEAAEVAEAVPESIESPAKPVPEDIVQTLPAPAPAPKTKGKGFVKKGDGSFVKVPAAPPRKIEKDQVTVTKVVKVPPVDPKDPNQKPRYVLTLADLSQMSTYDESIALTASDNKNTLCDVEWYEEPEETYWILKIEPVDKS